MTNLKRNYLNFYSIVGAAVFAYIFIRAFTVNITYDEVWTLMAFVPLSPTHIINCIPCNANNHLLNTVLVKLIYLVLPNNIFWARIPNVLAGLVYIVISARLGRKFLVGWPAYMFFLAMLCNPFLLDFFSLARGYGLSIGFMLGSIYGILCFSESGKIKHAFVAIAMASLAVLSNYTLLNFWFGAMFVLFFISFKRQPVKMSLVKLAGIGAGFAFFLFAIVYEPIRKLVLHGGLYFGGSSGFYSDTLESLIRYSLYHPDASIKALWVTWIFGIMLFLCVVAALISFMSFRDFLFSKAFLISLLFLIPAWSNIVQHFLIGTKYLVDRTGLFYYPLLVCVLMFWVAEIKYESLKKYANILLTVGVVFVGLNFLQNANFYKTITWQFESQNRKILRELQAKAEADSKNISVSGVWLYRESLSYQIGDFPNLTYVQPDREGSVSADYYLFFAKDLPRVGYLTGDQAVWNYEMDTALAFPDVGIYVFNNFRKKEE